MSVRPPKAYKLVTDELARLAASQPGLQLFQTLGLLDSWRKKHSTARKKGSSRNESQGEAAECVGIWRRSMENGSTAFRRSSSTEDALWSKRERIEKKGARRRIVLAGESVARGLFYDPHANCASVLESILNMMYRDWVEVIDLARTDIGQRQLIDVLRASVALEPDAMVIFAGNNWAPFRELTWFELLELGNHILEAKNWLSARGYLEVRLRVRVRQFLQEVHLLAQQLRIPLVLIIPEFNLLDWHSAGVAIPFLEANATCRWLDAANAAQKMLAAGDLRGARKPAEEMLALDGGVTPRPLEILGRLELANGNCSGARKFLEQARDTSMVYPQQDTPRCYSVIQSEMRNYQENNGLSIVDLPARLEEYLNGLPDRRCFLDYCHLTFDGMVTAMASVAELLLPALGKPSKSWKELAQRVMPPPPHVLGMAKLLAAAIMNSKYKQEQALVQQQIADALACDAGLERQLRNFADFLSRRAPFGLCESFCDFANTHPCAAASYMNPLSHRTRLNNDKYSQFRFLEAASQTLEKSQPDFVSGCRRLQMNEYGVLPGRTVNLLQRYFQPELHAGSIQGKNGFYREYQTQSRFLLLCRAGVSIAIKICYRIPESGQENADLIFYVNGKRLMSLPFVSKWTSVIVAIPSELILEGWNEIEISWPLSCRAWEGSIGNGLANLYRQIGLSPAEFYPVFGEISALDAQIAAGAPQIGYSYTNSAGMP